MVLHYMIGCASCVGARNEYYVRATGMGDAACPVNATCHEISYYVNDSRSHIYLADNTVFHFMKGMHMLEKEGFVNISKVNNILLKGWGEVERGFHETVTRTTVVIKCLGATGLSISNSSNVTIVGLTFIDCGHEVDHLLKLGSIDALNASLYFHKVHHLDILMVSVITTVGTGLVTVNCLPVNITCSSFARNINFSEAVDQNSGNMYAIFNGVQTERLSTNKFAILQSNFSFGISDKSSGGLQLILHYYSYNEAIKFSIDRVVLYNNTGKNGANFLFYVNSSCCYSLVLNNSLITAAKGEYGAGVSINHYTHHIQNTSNITITNTELADNNGYSGGAISIYWYSNSVAVSLNLLNCMIRDNIAYYNPAILVYVRKQFRLCNELMIAMKNVTLQNNQLQNYNHEQHDGGIAVFKNAVLSLNNVTMQNHPSSGLLTFDSKITFIGNSYFINNTGIDGGAMSLYDSKIRIYNNTHLNFLNNSATSRGGAIFISHKIYNLPVVSCFYEIADIGLHVTNARFLFSGNQAKNADILYGTDISRCIDFNKVFDFSKQNSSNLINTKATRVCFCENEWPNCTKAHNSVTIAPGAGVLSSVALVDISNNVTLGEIKITRYDNHQSVLHSTIHNVDSASCVNINITNITDRTLSLLLTLTSAYEPTLDETAKAIFFNRTGCPTGFALNEAQGICTCDNAIKKLETVECNIVTQSIKRYGDVWLSYTNQSCIVYTRCLFNYCTETEVTLDNGTNPDSQCAMNRTGFLCGRCRDGLSLRLGADNECVQCSNDYLALLLVFAFAGIALVVILVVLNITVSTGAINGLIFYANVVKLYKQTFFPSITPIPFLSQFISWMNLDWGFKTCFYDGLDACGKVWLQFVFPLYIWLLIGGISWLARRHPKISQLIGNNAVPVLATLILLSYNTLLQTVIKSLYIGQVPCGGFVWLVDGNLSFSSPCYTLLFIVSVLVLVFLIFPYTVFLLLLPLIEGPFSKYTFFRQINLKLKPFIDAYGGPYKDRYRFWPGLLLLMRVLLALVASLAHDNLYDNDILFFLLSGLLMVLFVSGGVYKSKIYTYVFVFLLLNLKAINFFTTINCTSSPRHNVLSIILLSSTVLVAIGIVAYHIHLCLKPVREKMMLRMHVPRLFTRRPTPRSGYAEIMHTKVLYTSIKETCTRDSIIFNDTTSTTTCLQEFT